MTDPKTAARAVATELAKREISIKHVQALDLIAAGCGFQDRSKLKDIDALPTLKRVNARLLESAATVIARHDLARRATIVETTSNVLVPRKTLDMRDVRVTGTRISDSSASQGVIPFMKMQMDTVASVSQGRTYRNHATDHVPIHDADVSDFIASHAGVVVRDTASTADELVAYVSEHAGIAAKTSPSVVAITHDAPNSPWTLFYNVDGGWGDFDAATVHADRRADLPVGIDMPNRFTIRWMDVEDAALRAGVDAALIEIDADDVASGDGTDDGERPLDYDRIAAIMDVAGTFRPSKGPLEIALRDGAQRASLYIASYDEHRDTPGGQLIEWVRDVEQAFASPRAPTEDEMRNLLAEGDAAVSGIGKWLPADERLHAWIDVASYPDVINMTIDREASGVTTGIDMKPLEQTLYDLKAQFAPTGENTSSPAEPRELAADTWYQAHNFGKDDVADHDGWEWTTPGDEWTRAVYVKRYSDDRDEIGDTEKLTYTVVFAPNTAKVVSSYAISADGNLVGHAIDPDHIAELDLGDGMTIPLAAVTGDLVIANLPNAEAIAERVTRDLTFERWQRSDGLDQDIATALASDAISTLRTLRSEDDREAALERVAARHLRPSDPEDDMWSEVRSAAQDLLDTIDGAMDDLDERPDWDRDEFEGSIMELAFARLSREDSSTWRDCLSRTDKVELYLHLLPKGDSVEETCTVNHPHLLPKNVVVNDQFRFVLSRLGIPTEEWKSFAHPNEVEKSRHHAPQRRGDRLVTPQELGVMIENGGNRQFLVSLYCQTPLRDVLALDMSKPIAFERVRLAVVDVMNGTFHDHRLEGVVEMRDGVDGLLTTSDCGPYASQTDDLVSSAYMSRIGAPDEIFRGPAATAELEGCLAVEGLRRNGDERIDWRITSDNAQGGVNLEADVPMIDPANGYSLRRVVAAFETAGAARPEITVGRRN